MPITKDLSEYPPMVKPTKYDKATAQEMCQMLSDGIPLREICRSSDKYPAWRTVYDWMKQDADLTTAIAYAREIGCDAIAEDCLRIADTPLLGEIITDDGEKVTVKKEDMLGHRKLQIETRLKLLAKFHPKKYGDKVAIGGDPENPIKVDNSSAIFSELVEALKMKRQSE